MSSGWKSAARGGIGIRCADGCGAPRKYGGPSPEAQDEGRLKAGLRWGSLVAHSKRAGGLVDEFDEDDLFVVVDFAEFDFDDFAAGGGDGAADELGFDGEFAVAAVDEDEELDALGAAVVEEGIEGGTDGASGVEDVVHKNDVAAGDVEAELALVDGGAGGRRWRGPSR